MDAIEKIARKMAELAVAPEIICKLRLLDDLAALNAAGFAIIDRKPTPSALLTIGLLSGAGPQSREQYIEALDAVIEAQEVRPDAS